MKKIQRMQLWGLLLSFAFFNGMEKEKKYSEEVEKHYQEFMELADEFVKSMEAEEAEKKAKNEVAQKEHAYKRFQELYAKHKKMVDMFLGRYLRLQPEPFYQYRSLLLLKDLATITTYLLKNEDRLTAFAAPWKTSFEYFHQALVDFHNTLVKEIKYRETHDNRSILEELLEPLRHPYTNYLDTHCFRDMTEQELELLLVALNAIQSNKDLQKDWEQLLKLSKGDRSLSEMVQSLALSLKKGIAIIVTKIQEEAHKAATLKKEEAEAAERAKKSILSMSDILREEFKAIADEKLDKTLRDNDFFKGIPADKQEQFLQIYYQSYLSKTVDPVLYIKKMATSKAYDFMAQRLTMLAQVYGYQSYAMHGYTYCPVAEWPYTDSFVLPNLIEVEKKLTEETNEEQRKKLKAEEKNIAQRLVKMYKVHLMPEEAMDSIAILRAMHEALEKYPELKAAIKLFKVLYNPVQVTVSGKTIVFARVVIYATDKDNAQKILDHAVKAFAHIKGSGIRPRFNAKVTELIWVAQGDGDYKEEIVTFKKEGSTSCSENIYKAYYEPSMVYYRPDITGIREEYHLRNPITKQDII